MTNHVAANLPPLLPTPARCPLLTPPPAMYTARVELDSKKQQPGRASMSQSWIKYKVDLPGRASRSSSWVTDKKLRTLNGGVELERLGRVEMPRENWKRPASRAPSVDRCAKKTRPPVEMVAASEAPILAGPAPSTGRFEAKPMAEMVADSKVASLAGPAASVDSTMVEASPLTGLAPSTNRSEKKLEPLTKMEADWEEPFFAGPTFILSPDPSELPMPTFIVSPDPSELPIPTFLYKDKLAKVLARLVAPMILDQQQD
ncbi:uncharacterized protein LOC123403291 [Hordeum vulgare subsp. vulgare]|uniref:Uncharacterized protein n=1 Tax=Hordeum vulgare subsp. vulgare TaxID=112509 RepID=A0A8I7BBN9_HORVV|nr:uncharacterized protein LOC123403291 [Hordeum vulgare subsp. vulgare]